MDDHMSPDAVTEEEAWSQHRDTLVQIQSNKNEGIPDTGGPLNYEEISRREYSKYTEKKILFDGEPGERIPAYLLIPRVASSECLPAILAAHQCAHMCDVGKEQVVGKCPFYSDQAYGLELVLEGFVVLAPDANKVGERYDPALRESWQRPADLGATQKKCCTAPGGSAGPIKWKPIFDAMRAIDLLTQCEPVDPARVGMIGHSLGAETTLRTMAVDERIKVGVISAGGLVHSSHWSYRMPYADALSIIAPRPFFEVTGHFDEVNCESEDPDVSVNVRMREKREAHLIAGRVYALSGHEERLERYEFDGGHAFPTHARQAAYRWLARWL
jgi:dienelactone hydrolase